MDEYAYKRLEREARARHAGTSRVGSPSRSTVCELCGGGDVVWGSMCQACRGRLLGGPGAGDEAVPVTSPLQRSPKSRRRRRPGGGVIAPPATATGTQAPAAEATGRPGMSLIQNVPGAIYRCLTDRARTVVFVTHQICSMTGRTAAEFRPGASNLTSLVHPDDAPQVAAQLAALADGDAFECEYRLVTATGERWVHDRAHVVVDDAGHRFMDGVLMDVTDRRRAQDEMQWMALHDPLTTLPNRRAFAEELAEELGRADDRRNLSAAVFDIDHFKAINDTHGHEAGDRALVEVAARLRSAVGGAGSVSRTGGEEFVALLPGHSLAQAIVVAELARREVGESPVSGMDVTVSGGVACLATGDDLVGNADTALYRAKHEGRNRVVAFP